MNTEPITILICALGGEGGGVLAEWLYDCAVHAGHSAQATSVPGVAQRTGATTYYIEVCPQPNTVLDAEFGGRRPSFSLNPVPGAIDLLVSSELLETVRQIGAGMASAERTEIISSSARALTVAEKMTLGDGRQSQAPLLATIQRHSAACELLDMAALAAQHGTVVSAVLLGCIAASGKLPFGRELFEAAIRSGGKGVNASLRGFAAAYDAIAARRAQQAQAEAFTAALLAPAKPTPGIPPAIQAALPPQVHTMAALGHARLVDYQDPAYAALYLQRLQAVAQAERVADPSGSQAYATTNETARWLALWMAFDDIVRVAAHKASAARQQRVRREVAAGEGDIVKVYDHFKPGVAEFAALLPAKLAQRLTARDELRRTNGKEPWAMPLKLGAHTVVGALVLRLLASSKWLRRIGSRFATEQALIEHWLAAITRGCAEDWSLGHELAQCGRLIKGYGSTNERGKANLLHIADHLALPHPGADATQRADGIHAAREAALADDKGTALDAALVQHGAPARAVRAQPIRWYKRRPDMPAPQGMARQ